MPLTAETPAATIARLLGTDPGGVQSEVNDLANGPPPQNDDEAEKLTKRGAEFNLEALAAFKAAKAKAHDIANIKARLDVLEREQKHLKRLALIFTEGAHVCSRHYIKHASAVEVEFGSEMLTLSPSQKPDENEDDNPRKHARVNERDPWP